MAISAIGGSDQVPFHPEDKDEFVSHVQMEFRSALDKTADWRSEAEQAYDYDAGEQWTDQDKADMEEQLRPIITFNRTAVFISAVTGLETINREEVRYYPRRSGVTNQGQVDLWNAAAKYINDDCDAESHHSHAFRDMVICGMGWSDTKLNFETNPDGDIDISRISPMSMFWDARATERNLRDARWVMHIDNVPMSEIKESWPEKADEITYSKMFDNRYELTTRPHHADQAWKYERDQARKYPVPNNVQLVRYQYYKKKPYYRVMTPEGVQELSVEEFKDLKEQIESQGMPFPFESMRLRRREYRQAYFVGDTMLEDEPLPVQANSFTFQCMTGMYDQNENTWYGMVRGLRDPQDWTNKLFSQILHIINSNAKGGLMAERDAFDNPMKAERDWAKPDSITYMKPGAIQNGKVLQKQPIQYPAGLDRLMTFAMQMFVEVTGVNLELLGMANKVQPGVLESQRKQSGMTLLAWAFDSIRQYRRQHGKVLAAFIREYLADGRLIRVANEGGEQYIPLVRDDLAMEYDVVVDTSPTSVNEKERVFAAILQLLPSMARMGIMPPPELIDYLPIPATLAAQWKQSAAQQAEQAGQMGDMEAQLEQRNKMAEALEKESQAILNQAKAQSEQFK